MKRTLTILALLLAACAGENPATSTSGSAPAAPATPPPSATEAKAIIEKSGAFSELEFTNAAYSLPVAAANLNDVTRDAAKQLAAAGWLDFDGSSDIALNDKSGTDKRFLLRDNGILDIVPLARKEMGEVTAVRPNPDGSVNVDFTWKWIPNEVGQAFKSGMLHDRYAAPQDSSANLMWNGTEWVVISIE